MSLWGPTSVLQTRQAALVSAVMALWALGSLLIFLVSPQHDCLELPAKFAGEESIGKTVRCPLPQRPLVL